MTLELLLGIALGALLLSLVMPTGRRAWVFGYYATKQGLRWLASAVGLRKLWAKVLGREYEPFTLPTAMRHFAEDMGPTFIKFGQIVASSSGMFPDRFVEEFKKCLDRVRPFGFDEVQRILESELGPEVAARLEDIDPEPLASASIAQVHTARLDGETDVVIKVQRPGLDGRVRSDMVIMRRMARLASAVSYDARLANPVGIVEDFAETLSEELDFRKEAKNLDSFNDIMRELGHGDVRAPVPHWDLTSRRVLVMERFFGTRVDDTETIREREINAEDRLVVGMRAWFQCVLHYGFFHGDVHAGNLMLLDNDDLGFLDFGIVGRFDDEQRAMVTDYLIAFASGDFKSLARTIAAMGGVKDGIDLEAFAADLEDTYKPLLSMKMGDINYADFLPKLQHVARRHAMIMPKEFVLITKQMLYFDRYAKLLAPQLNVFSDPRLMVSLMQDIQKAKMAQQQQPPSTAN